MHKYTSLTIVNMFIRSVYFFSLRKMLVRNIYRTLWNAVRVEKRLLASETIKPKTDGTEDKSNTNVQVNFYSLIVADCESQVRSFLGCVTVSGLILWVHVIRTSNKPCSPPPVVH